MSGKTIAFNLLCVLFFSAPIAWANPIKKTFPYSVVEVLVDRQKDENAELNRPIPLQKIPFKQRTDKYLSIGTAWFINDKELFSAAHVFPTSLVPFTQNFYVRTMFGEVFPVDMVTLYSNRFDIVSFTLKNYPKKVVPISVTKSYGIGDDVCVPGNALGQGISLRCGGQISSLAPEPKNGEWKEIYFSTPVSPGNSGGPLIDASGRAIGIVVRKIPGEDLNIATPFSELKKQTGKLEYFEKDLGYQNSAVMPLYAKSDFSASSNQPMAMMDWMKLLVAGTNDHLSRMAKAYESAWLKNGVLNSRQAKDYLKSPRKTSFFTQVKFVNQDLSTVDGDEGQIEKYRKTKRRVLLQRIGEKSLLFIGKNRDERVDALLANPRELMNAALSSGKLMQRKVGDEELSYLSLGQPTYSSQVTDLLGRNWLMYTWKMNEIQAGIGLYCTPRPTDVACYFHVHDAMLAPETVAAMFRVDISELMLGYVGSSTEWVEFLGPASRLRPAFMASVAISRAADGKMRIAAQDLSIVSPGSTDGNDSIVVNFGADPMNALKQTAYSISYLPNLADKIIVSAVRFYKNGRSPSEMNGLPGAGGIFKTKAGKYMAARRIEGKNSNVAVMGLMYGDEEKKLNRFWKSTEFGMNSPAPAPVLLTDRR